MRAKTEIELRIWWCDGTLLHFEFRLIWLCNRKRVSRLIAMTNRIRNYVWQYTQTASKVGKEICLSPDKKIPKTSATHSWHFQHYSSVYIRSTAKIICYSCVISFDKINQALWPHLASCTHPALHELIAWTIWLTWCVPCLAHTC